MNPKNASVEDLLRQTLGLYQERYESLEPANRVMALGVLLEFLVANDTSTLQLIELVCALTVLDSGDPLPQSLSSYVDPDQASRIRSRGALLTVLGDCGEPHKIFSACRDRIGGFDARTDPARLKAIRDRAGKALAGYAGMLLAAHLASGQRPARDTKLKPELLSLLPWALRRLGYPIPASMVPQELTQLAVTGLARPPMSASAGLPSIGSSVPQPPRDPSQIASWLGRLQDLEKRRSE